VVLVPVALHNDPIFIADAAEAVRKHNSNMAPLVAAPAGGAPARKWAQSLLANAKGGAGSSSTAMLVTPLLATTVRRIAAAVTIQACWRAHKARREEQVGQRVLERRAAICIQRTWSSCECPDGALSAAQSSKQL
jgi:hypothetical protein